MVARDDSRSEVACQNSTTSTGTFMLEIVERIAVIFTKQLKKSGGKMRLTNRDQFLIQLSMRLHLENELNNFNKKSKLM